MARIAGKSVLLAPALSSLVVLGDGTAGNLQFLYVNLVRKPGTINACGKQGADCHGQVIARWAGLGENALTSGTSNSNVEESAKTPPGTHRQREHRLGRGRQAWPLPIFPKGRNDRMVRDYQSSRTTVRVLTGSFIAASRRASRATVSLTPSISNMMRPGFTFAAHRSTEPLPLPIRTSIGFAEIGVSGKMRIQTRPLTLHVPSHCPPGCLDLP